MLTPQQTHVILSLIERQTALFAAQTLGEQYLSDNDKKILTENGIDFKKVYDESKDLVSLNFHLGLLSKILGDNEAQKLSYEDLTQYIQRGGHIPLNAREKATLQSIKMQSMSDIRSANQRIFRDVNNVVGNQLMDARANQAEFLRDQIAEHTADRLSRRAIARKIARLTGDWNRDFNKSVQYISHTALNEGRAALLHRRYGDNKKVKVYFQVQPQACDACVKAYLINGPGSEPIVFELHDLERNGNNIGKKQKEWRPTVGPMHPNSLTEGRTLVLTDNGWKQIRNIGIGEYVLTHRGRFRKVVSTLKAKADKKYVNQKVIVINYKIVDKTGLVDKHISVTDEHKILTQFGWVKAGDLVVGQHKLMRVQQPCSCGCGKYVDVIDSGRMTFNNKCKARISARNAKKLATNEVRNGKLSIAAKKRWGEGKCANTLRYLKSTEHRESARKRMLAGGAIIAMKAASSNRTSKVQVKLFDKVKQLFPEAELEYSMFGRSLDIAIPSLKVDIEYDGSIWHNRPKNIIADKKRDDLLKSNGWHVIRYVDSLPGLKRICEDVNRVANNSTGQYQFVELEIKSINTFPAYTSKHGVNLFDIGVDEDESFVAKGIVIHNCRCLLTEYREASKWDDEKKRWVLPEHPDRVSHRPKIRVVFNEKEHWV